MGINFREALATLSRALPLVLFRAGIFVAGGFMIIIIFGMLLFTFRFAGVSSPVVVIAITMLAVLGWWVSARVLQRFLLYRQQAAMLFLFSGRKPASPGLPAALQESGRIFPNHSRWAALNRKVRLALFAFTRGGEESFAASGCHSGRNFSRIPDLLTLGPVSHGILVLAISRGDRDVELSTREALALYFRIGHKSRRLTRQWLWLSASGLAFLFICLALPNWFFFASAGAPVAIGIVLAAVIAWLLHQAFVIPFVLAGMSGALLAETRGKTPDPGLCEKLDSLIPDTVFSDKRTD